MTILIRILRKEFQLKIHNLILRDFRKKIKNLVLKNTSKIYILNTNNKKNSKNSQIFQEKLFKIQNFKII